MIKISKPYIEIEGQYALLKARISIDDKSDIIWFKVEKKYKDYLCDERSDAYLVATLNYAMINSHDIELEAPISENLLLKIENILIPALCENNHHYYKPNIIAQTTNEPLPNAGAVGTGISCGVDSLHAVASKSNTKYKSHNLTHLTFNNVGSHGIGEEARTLFHKRLQKSHKFAEEYGYEFVPSDSNLMDVISQSHFKTHTYSSMFAVLCLQKLFSVYYYASSGNRFNQFYLKDEGHNSCGKYELLSLPVFSTQNTRIYSEGMGLSRLEKINEIKDYTPSHQYLSVCLIDNGNCGHCPKCIRTQLELDALGVLEKYKNVFDIEDYKRNKSKMLKYLFIKNYEKYPDFIELMPYFKSQINYKIKLMFLLHIIKLKIKNIIRR